MRLLLDENLSPRLVQRLAGRFPESLHVRDIGMARSPDSTIWLDAARRGLTILSKDTDFAQRSLLLGAPPKVIWLRVGNASTDAIERLIVSRAAELQAFETDPVRTLLVLSP